MFYSTLYRKWYFFSVIEAGEEIRVTPKEVEPFWLQVHPLYHWALELVSTRAIVLYVTNILYTA